MKKFSPTIIFNLGFWVCLFVFLLANRVSYPMNRSLLISPRIGLLNDGHAFGFPFTHYFVWGGTQPETATAWPVIIINVIVALICSFIVGWAFNKYFRKNATAAGHEANNSKVNP